MNATQLRQLARDRVLDATALMAARRWSGAYYLAGYAVECGLKACVLQYVIRTGVIFQNKKFGEQCWTHKLADLVELADLKSALAAEHRSTPDFANARAVVLAWNEGSRYKQTSRQDAEKMVAAVTDPACGVLRWVEQNWRTNGNRRGKNMSGGTPKSARSGPRSG